MGTSAKSVVESITDVRDNFGNIAVLVGVPLKRIDFGRLYDSGLLGAVIISDESLEYADETGTLEIATYDFDDPDNRVDFLLRSALNRHGVALGRRRNGAVFVTGLSPIALMFVRGLNEGAIAA